MGMKGKSRRFSISMVTLAWFWQALTRRKVVDLSDSTAEASRPEGGAAGDSAPSSSSPTQLARVLTTFDLTALGVGSTLGVGVYVLAGSVARDYAGPAVVISFFVAALASVFAGLCYAEFGARVPLAGSAYIYSYVSIGEFMAFVIGWNLIMEYVIGCASVARGLSNYLDQLSGYVMQEAFLEVWHLHVDFLSPYIDFFAFAVSFLLSVVLAFGVKESMNLNNIFTLVNVSVVLFVIVAGSLKADISNWQIDKASIPDGVRGGDGGFFPFGVMGVLRGAATCFYGFVGFDCIATTGEEVKNPQKAIPIAIIVSLVIIFLSYFGVSAVLTLMWPYYLQDPDAPLPFVFHQIGWTVAQWIVAVGGIFGLFASLFGAMYPLPRVIYAMANDGLIYRFLGEVHPKYKTPLVGTLLAGVITGLMAALFKLQQLVNMLSIGTLVAYTMVAACVLLLRYRHVIGETTEEQVEDEAVSLLSDSEKLTDDIYRESHEHDGLVAAEYKETTNLVSLKEKPTVSKLLAQIFNWQGLKSPTAVTSRLVAIEVILLCVLSVALGLCLVHMENELIYGHWDALTLVCAISSLMLLVVLSMSLQPNSTRTLPFKVPFVPVIPAISITLNIYLILMLDIYTWVRFMIWMGIGAGVYFTTSRVKRVQATTALETTVKASSSLMDTKESSVSIISSTINPDISEANLTNNPLIQDDLKSLNGPNGEDHVAVIEELRNSPDEGINYDRQSSIGANSHDFDNTSITEVTNELLSLTYQNALHTGKVESERNLKFTTTTENEGGSDERSDPSDGSIVEDISPMESDYVDMKEPCDIQSFKDDDLSINIEDNETEDDVRSLYPDVVVISSSDDEIPSKTSTLTSSSLVESNTFVVKEFESTTVDRFPEHDLKTFENTVPIDCSKNVSSEAATKRKSPLVVKPNTLTNFQFGSMKIETSSVINENIVTESKVSSPLKNSSFVEKLEKIIGAQSSKITPNSSAFIQRTQSMVEITKPASGGSLFPVKVNQGEKLLNGQQQLNLSELEGKKLGEDVLVGISASDKSTENTQMKSSVDGDIRAKLERIFSNGINSVSSQTGSTNVEQQPLDSNENNYFDSQMEYEKGQESEGESGNANILSEDQQNEISETRRRMASVLGSLVVQNLQSSSSTKG